MIYDFDVNDEDWEDELMVIEVICGEDMVECLFVGVCVVIDIFVGVKGYFEVYRFKNGGYLVIELFLIVFYVYGEF